MMGSPGQSANVTQSDSIEPTTEKAKLGRLTPVDRLNLSRARIRQSMQGGIRSKNDERQRGTSWAGALWLDRFKAIPGGAMLIHAVNVWWSKQALRAVVTAAADAAKTVVRPVAQRHPLVLVSGAFALGCVLAWSRPWRWISKPIVLSGLTAPLLSKIISSLPSAIWAEAFNSLLRHPQDPPVDPLNPS